MFEYDIQDGKKEHRNWILIFIFLLGFSLRLYGISWGFPNYFHPDERQIMFKVTDISLEDPNPHFFAYGSFPIYLLKGVVVTLDKVDWKIVRLIEKIPLKIETKRKLQNLFPRLSNFRGQTITGRALSALFSAWTILVVYAIGNILYKRKTAVVASSLFAFSVLSIQQAHFYVVDGIQTLFVSIALLFMIKTILEEKTRYYYFSGIFIGLAMATKFSTLPILLPYFVMQLMATINGKKRGVVCWLHWFGGIIVAVLVMTAGMPYWILDFKHWWHDVSEQKKMVTGVARLPYTIQYINTMPFGYLLKNMVLWSMGIPLGLAVLAGFVNAVRRIFTDPKDSGNIILLSWVLPLFILNSTFQVKFLRYTLPMFPMFAVFAAFWLMSLQSKIRKSLAVTILIVVIAGAFLWSIAFVAIYASDNTRIQASDWIYENIPSGSHILIESSWDDALPVGTDKGSPGNYERKKLEIYKEPDNFFKAESMAEKLVWGDVIILASKRHYGSVLRVPNRYPICGNFYRSLFAEKLGYKFVKSFINPPHLGPIKFHDDLADESFRVYEHPKVDVFIKETQLTKEQILAYLKFPPPEIKSISYNEILKAVPVDSIGSRVSHPILRWIIVLELIGFISFPLVFQVFHRFPHKGYPLAKVTGLLVTAYLCWIIPSLKLIPFSRTLIFFVISILLFINFLIYLVSRQEINRFFKNQWWSVLGYEIVFFIIFFLFVFLKSYNPDIFWSESSMDFGFINSILRSEYFPPADPWIQGEVINYYYYGHYLASFLTLFSGVEAAYGYNLFFVTIPALVALAISSILLTLTRRIWVGLLGVIFSIIIGNLDGFVQLVRIWVFQARNTPWESVARFVQSIIGSFLVLGRSAVHFRFFRSAHELINPTVHEFPFWSYNFMDLHAHTIATLISTFIISLQLVLFRNKQRGLKIFGEGISRYMTFIVIAVAIGALNPTNSWDFPTQVLMMIIISLWIYLYYTKQEREEKRPVLVADEKSILPDYADERETEKDVSKDWVEEEKDLPETENDILYAEDGSDKLYPDKIEDYEEPDDKHINPDNEIPDVNSDQNNEREDGIEEEEERNVIEERKEKEKCDSTDEDEVDCLNSDDEKESRDDFTDTAVKEDLPKHSAALVHRINRLGYWIYNEITSDITFLYEILSPAALIVVTSIILYLPYFMYFSRSNMGVGTLWQYKQTTNLDGFLTMFGLFIFIILTQMTKWWMKLKIDHHDSLLRVSMSFLMILISVLISYILFKTIHEIDYSVLLLSVVLGYFAVNILFKGHLDDDQSFVLLLLIMALAIVAGCEIFFVKDFYQGGDHRRFNTIFKFYMQVWFFFAIVSAYLVGHRFKIRGTLRRFGKNFEIIRTSARWIWNILFVFLLAASFVFTVAGPMARRHHDEYKRVDLPLTLDGHAYMKQGKLRNEYRAIHWLNRNVRGQPVILEASGPDYRYEYGRISANTGLPTVLGWWSHVDQRQYKRRYVEMRNDIKTIYESMDIPKVLELLRKYCIRYIYIGLTEKNQAQYTEAGLEKFKELTSFMTPVYSNPDVTIYKVNDYGLNVDFAKAMQSSDVLKDLQERLARERAERIEQKEREEKLRKERLMKQPPRTMFQGGHGEARGMFNEPRSLCVAENGEVYVADFRNHRIQRFDSSGKWLMMWGSTGEGPGQFNDICDIAVDDKNVYVLDTFNNRIQKFNRDGKFIAEWREAKGNFFYPRGIAADGNGHIYVCDTGHHRIVKLDTNGKFIHQWGQLGDHNGEFEDPIGICVNGEKVYVADVKNHRIQVFDLDGKFIRSFKVDGWEGEVFVEPYLTVDNSGRIWVSDPTANRIIVFNENGNLIKYIGDKLRFAHPMGLDIDKTGNILVVDTHHHRIVKLKSE